MLKAIERILKTKIGELSLPDQEKAEASRDAQIDHRRREVLRPEVDKIVQAPNFRKAWQTPRSRKDSGLAQAHIDTVRSRSLAGESPAGESGKGAEQGDRLGRRRSNRLRWK